MPLTESIAEAAPFGSSLADHQKPPRSASVNAAGSESDFQVISPARFSIWISSIACPSWEESARCGGIAKDFARSVFEIGRASCRERVWISVDGVTVIKKLQCGMRSIDLRVLRC